MGWVDLASEFSLYFETGGGGGTFGLIVGQGFFLCTSGAVYGPLSQCKIP